MPEIVLTTIESLANEYLLHKGIEPGADPEMEEGDALSGGCCACSV